jgi:hypothetical protein
MKNWRSKILPTILAGTLTFSMGVGAVSAKPSWAGNGQDNGKGKAMQKQKFKDMSQAPWASRAIEMMNQLEIVNGYEDETFKPNKAVSQAEAIVMVVRALGLEDGELNGGSYYFRGNVPNWAKPYLEYAIENNLVTEKEVQQSNKPASRMFVTKLLVNALIDGDVDLSNTTGVFTDLGNLTDREKAYVALAFLKDLVNGYGDKSFKPNKPVTRAEMAQFLLNLGYSGDFDFHRSVRGFVQDVTSTSIKVGGKVYIVNNDVTVYLDGKSADFADIEEGMRVILALQDGKVAFIDAKTDSDSDDEDTDYGVLKNVDQLDVLIEDEDDDKTVELTFERTSSGYEAEVIVKVNGTTTVSKDEEEALDIIEKLFRDAGVTSSSDSLNVHNFVGEVADNYNLDGELDVDLSVEIGDKEYNFDNIIDVDTAAINWGALGKVSEFDLTVDTTGEDVELTFEKTGYNTYTASVKNKVGTTTQEETGEDALDLIEEIADAAIDNNGNVDLEKAVEKIDAMYDLSGTADVVGKLVYDGNTTSIDKDVDVSPENLGNLVDVDKIDITFNSIGKDVTYFFERKSNGSYDASVEIDVTSGTDTTLTGEDAVEQLQELKAAITTSQGIINILAVINWADGEHNFEGSTEVEGSVKVDGAIYTIDQLVNF